MTELRRPFVTINMASSVDGKITSATREYPAMTSAYDRDNMDRIRAASDALIIGAQTIRSDSPLLHVRSAMRQAERVALGKPHGLPKIVVTASADIDPRSRSLEDPDGGGVIIATVTEAPAARLAALESVAQIWKIGSGRVDLVLLLDRLADKGVERALVEGGGELNWQMLELDLVDELCVTFVPALLGGREAPTLLEGTGLSIKQRRKLRLSDLHREGDELFCVYSVKR